MIKNSFEEQQEVHRKSMEAVDRLLNELPKEELNKMFAEAQAMSDPNGITAEEYFDSFEYEYQRFWESLTGR